MWNDTKITRQLGMRYPIIQAPMAGGLSTPALVAAVSNCGGLGFLGAGYMKPPAIREAVQEIRQLTKFPFGVNLFIPPKRNNTVDMSAVNSMKQHLSSLKNIPHEIGKEILELTLSTSQIDFSDQLSIIVEEHVPIFSFTFGTLPSQDIENLKSRNIHVMGTATTEAEALALEMAGVSAVVVQGAEAGGHRGSFLESDDSSLVGLMALVPQVVDQLKIPVIASGGIMDGRGIAAALALGASGVQMGTAFIPSRECGAHPQYKEAVLKSHGQKNVLTSAFSGKPARIIQNTFAVSMQQYQGPIPPYPLQNALTTPIRNWAAKHTLPDFMSLWAGQASPLSRESGAADLMVALIEETSKALESFR